jgi:hypothetical protein
MGGSGMSRRWFLLLALLVVVVLALVGGGAVWLARPKKTAVTIDVYPGTPGVAFKGTAEVDGRPQELTGTVPKQFVLEGYRVTYSLTSTEDSGEFRVRAVLGDITLGSAGSEDPPRNGIRGWVKSGWGWSRPKHWIECFPRDGEAKWLTPPPP